MTLVDPASCPGLSELAGAVILRVFPSLTAASLVGWIDVAAMWLAGGAFFLLAHRVSRSMIAALAATAGVMILPLIHPSLGFSGAPVFMAAALTLYCFAKSHGLGLTLGAGSLLAALSPPLAIPAAMACGIFAVNRQALRAGSRAALILAAACGPIAAAAATILLLPKLPLVAAPDNAIWSCLASIHVARPSPDPLIALLTGLGPLAAGFSLLGVFACRSALRAATPWPAVVLAGAPLVLMSLGAGDASHLLIPAQAGVWCLVAAGIAELQATLGTRPAHRLGAIVLAAAVPLLESTHHPVPDQMIAEPRGHDALSRRTFARLLSETPVNAVVVIDDALTDLLDRSLQIATPSGAVRKVVSRQPDHVAAALRTNRVFVLPRAALELQHRGFALDDQAVTAVTGVYELHAGEACTVVEATWRSVPALTRASQLALVSSRPDARGPVVAYVTGVDPDVAAPVDWPLRARRGFDQHTYDLTRPGDRQGLQSDIAADGAPAGDPVFSSQAVTRLEIWRVPEGPFVLPVRLGRAPAAVIAYNRSASDGSGIALCPSFAHAVSPIEIRGNPGISPRVP